MAVNNFLPFCPTDTGTNLETQIAYAADANRTNGNQPGIASSKLNNKAIRQATWVAAQLAQYMVNITGSDVLDDQNSTNFQTTLSAALKNNAVRSVTSNDVCTAADSILILSGASFTETLFTAVGNTGKVLTLMYNGTIFTNSYTLNTTGGQTIGGIASGSYVLSTTGEVLRIFSDGTNWQILDHKTETPWQTATIAITGTTTNPVLGTIAQNNFKFKRRGAGMEYIYTLAQNAAGSGTTGTGDYLLTLPNSLLFDSNAVVYNTTVGPNSIPFGGAFNGLGYWSLCKSGSVNAAFVAPYSTSQFRIFFSGSNAPWASGSPYTFNVSAFNVTGSGYLPINAWQP